MPETSSNYGVFIQGVEGREQHKRMMVEHPSGKFFISDNIHQADVVLFTGGPDIDPAIYGEKNVACEYIDFVMDKGDLAAINLSKLKYKIGICRGGQMLNCAVGGGKMWQDVDGHNGTPHHTKDLITGEEYLLNSVHHQMMRPGPTGQLIACTKVSTFKDGYERMWKRSDIVVNSDSVTNQLDPEVIWYEKEDALCFQPHPEYNHPSTRRYFYELIDRYVLKALPPF